MTRLLQPLSVSLTLRPAAEVTRVPPLARALLRPDGAKPRAAARLGRKFGRALFRLVHQRLALPAPGEIVIDPSGARHLFRADFANTGYLDFANRAEGYEPEVTALLQALAPHLRVVYDIGANWGYFSALIATAPGFAGRIEAFEIAPGTHADLAALIAAAGWSARVHAHPCGLSDRSGTRRIAEGLHSFLTHVSQSGAGRAVRVERLDDLELPDPDLLKIDVEGHEAAVLRGGLERLSRARPLIVFENWHDEAEAEALLEPLRILESLGYAFMRLIWIPAGTGRGRLDLTPLTIEMRRGQKQALNLLAVHPDGKSLLREALG